MKTSMIYQHLLDHDFTEAKLEQLVSEGHAIKDIYDAAVAEGNCPQLDTVN